MKMFTRILVATVLALGLTSLPVPRLLAQAAVNATTTSASVNATTRVVNVTSASTMAVGQVLYIDRELMPITAISGTAISVARGSGGTFAAAHASGAVVYSGPPNYFGQVDVVGACTATSEVALPRFNTVNGNAFTCQNSAWQILQRGGYPAFLPTVVLSGQTYTALGAITIQPGVSFINGTTLAMTLANPTTAQNGMVMIIEAANASAHTVTYTAGFNGGTTARDVATFGGAIGDNLVIFANNGVWWVISTRNVTIA